MLDRDVHVLRRFCLVVALVSMPGGCASLVGSATSRMADNISVAILNQDDPETVRDGAPAYLLMLDGLVGGDPENVDLLLSAARLYGSYSGAFIDDEDRARRLAAKSLEYARRALCLELSAICEALSSKLDRFEQSLATARESDIRALYAFAAAWAGWIRSNAGDWNAIADLPKVRALFERCLVLDETHDGGSGHVYLGVLKTLLPEALGGRPAAAREHFERALEISAGENLMIKVLMAKHYARAVFDRELHDSLLASVQAASADYPGYVLVNVLAKREAERLLAESGDYF